MNGLSDRTLFDELLWVHGIVRRDLDAVRELAAAASNGAPAGEIRTEVEALKTNGPLWQLKVNCLHYCRFVHSHHGLEDRSLFPMLRLASPELGPVIDRLEADHRKVAELLDAVEEACDALGAEGESERRAALTAALDGLANHLLEHLSFEEESVEETMRAMPAR